MIYKRNNILRIGIALISIFIVILLVVIFSKKTKSKVENEEVIQHVVEQIFTCPDNEMVELFRDMDTAIHDITPSLSSKSLLELDNSIFSNIDKKLEEIYASYISDKWFSSFVNHFYMKYYIYSTAIGYETMVDHIVITQSETIPTNYSFTIYLNYGPTDGYKKDIEIEGSAQILQDDEKISYIQFFADKSFMLELRENNVFNQ